MAAHSHGGEAGVAPNGDGLVAGLELLVSHVRRTNGGASAGADGTLDVGGGGYEGVGGDLLLERSGFVKPAFGGALLPQKELGTVGAT